MVKTKKLNELFTNISTDSITEINKLIYARAKLASKKVSVPLRNVNRNTKPGWEIRLEGQEKKLQPQVKILKKEKHEAMSG